ncbi:MAG: hypothetical protein HY695_34635 [Deltaproteobacteria bacterium]|nr:hypothetical protein [Deltaproteobacteria bacterium]
MVDDMEKLYVNEIRPDDEVSTVGLFYSRAEAENVVAQLRSIPERRNNRYEIVPANKKFLMTRHSQRSREGKNP